MCVMVLWLLSALSLMYRITVHSNIYFASIFHGPDVLKCEMTGYQAYMYVLI